MEFIILRNLKSLIMQSEQSENPSVGAYAAPCGTVENVEKRGGTIVYGVEGLYANQYPVSFSSIYQNRYPHDG